MFVADGETVGISGDNSGDVVRDSASVGRRSESRAGPMEVAYIGSDFAASGRETDC